MCCFLVDVVVVVERGTKLPDYAKIVEINYCLGLDQKSSMMWVCDRKGSVEHHNGKVLLCFAMSGRW